MILKRFRVKVFSENGTLIDIKIFMAKGKGSAIKFANENLSENAKSYPGCKSFVAEQF